MASIFTFDPDPPRVASPWSTSGTSTPECPGGRAIDPVQRRDRTGRSLSLAAPGDTLEVPLTKLGAEPQDGPTEYKLHLLLRPRRSFSSTTSGSHISGSNRPISSSDVHRRTSETRLSQTPPLASSTQGRQHRLEQLTTQLLWRLQQSSPYHASAPNNLILPSLPQVAGGIGVQKQAERVLPGLEESRGALYELGVADDGTFVGLAQDELDESLHNLRAMAATLGCSVELLRKVAVGECEWFEVIPGLKTHEKVLRKGTLWVAEAFVKPNLGVTAQLGNAEEAVGTLVGVKDCATPSGSDKICLNDIDQCRTEQVRITLTGATMSGKSSLLGSLSNATLDNGRGKSRLSLLKHRHEIVSGMTSSVTQELLGYCSDDLAGSNVSPVRIVNYASADVASWFDIHSLCQGGRLVFFSDSAGHPRYRRTTVRGLVGWAPHWTLLCVPADNAEDTSGMSGSTPPLKDLLGRGTSDVDLSEAHLQICLDLHVPLVIAITKLDLASKFGLRQLLAKLLTILKATGRKPVILPDSSRRNIDSESLQIEPDDLLAVRKTFAQTRPNSLVVPVVLTSAVSGTGISKLHALLHELPLPVPTLAEDTIHGGNSLSQATLFHLEDVYFRDEGRLTVVSGILRRGRVSVGDELMLGPFATGSSPEDSESSPKLRPNDVPPAPRSFPGALKPHKGLPPLSGTSREEWRRVKVVSVRNLRLPVRTLHVDQVGTIGLQRITPSTSMSTLERVRKGMVLASGSPMSSSAIEAEFEGIEIRALSVGSLVVVYVASIRATAKIIFISVGKDPEPPSNDVEEGAFQFDFGGSDDDFDEAVEFKGKAYMTTIVRFRFISSREYVETNQQILILPGGGPGLSGGNARGEKGLAGLDGFVGKTTRAIDE